MIKWRRASALAAVAMTAAITVAACSDPGTGSSASSSSPATAGSSAASSAGGTAATAVTEDVTLHNALPAAVQSAGKLTIATIDSQPPWAIPASNPTNFTGAANDFSIALAKLLGIQLQRAAVPALSSIIPGIQAGRYDFALGPVGDTKTGEGEVDFVDWVKEQVVFAVPQGNPKHLDGLSTTCGLKIGVIAGGASGPILTAQSAKCAATGKPAVTVQDYSEQPQAILAVQSGRSDAYFSSRALLTYYVQQSSGGLQLAATGSTNGYPADFYQGAVFPKGSTQLRGVIEKAFAELKQDGTYDAILDKWGLGYMSISNFGINLVGGSK
ncbi:MAG: ABC transporter substrate-binding protein [Trebonia sp.]